MPLIPHECARERQARAGLGGLAFEPNGLDQLEGGSSPASVDPSLAQRALWISRATDFQYHRLLMQTTLDCPGRKSASISNSRKYIDRWLPSLSRMSCSKVRKRVSRPLRTGKKYFGSSPRLPASTPTEPCGQGESFNCCSFRPASVTSSKKLKGACDLSPRQGGWVSLRDAMSAQFKIEHGGTAGRETLTTPPAPTDSSRDELTIQTRQ